MRLASSMAISRRRRRSGLQRARGDVAGQRAEQEEHGGDDEEAPEVLLVGEQLVPGQPGEAVQEEDEAEDDEDAGGDPDDRALDELGDLLGHLDLGQLDLLAHEQRGALGDLLDRLRDVLGGGVGVSAGRSSAQPLEDEGGDDTAGEGGADEDLGMLLDRQVGQRARQGRRSRRCRAAARSSRRPRPRPAWAAARRSWGCGGPRSLRRIFPEGAAPNHRRERAWWRSRRGRRDRRAAPTT